LYAKTHLNLPVEVGFIQQAKLPADHFDIITLHHVLEHLDDPFSILVKIRESLRDKGFLVVEVPNIEATCFAPIHRFHAAHLYNFNPETLEAIGNKAGYEVHKTRISADGGVITTIFRKAEKTENFGGEIPGNYEKIVKILERHTSLTHFLTINPYIRPIKKLQLNINEKLATKNEKSRKAVLDDIVENLRKDNFESL
jgi:SAM-dependent methyltransferase